MLILVGLLVIGILVAGIIGVGPLAFGQGPEREGGIRWASAPLALVAGAAVVVVLAVAAVVLVGLPGASDQEGPDAGNTDAAPEDTTSIPVQAGDPDDAGDADTETPPPRVTTPVSLGPVVRLAAEDRGRETFPTSYEVVDGLEPNTVLRMRVDRFDTHAAGHARQCVTTTRTACGNVIDVQFDANGTASFQYLVIDDFAFGARAGQCRAGTARCSVVVDDLDGEHRAEIQTVFHEEATPPGRIDVTPFTGLVDGQRVTVTVAGYPPGVQVQAMLCAAPDAAGARRCGAPGPTAPLTVGPDGTGSTRLTIRSGPVGRERVVCGRGRVCGVTAASEMVYARAQVVPIMFAAPSGAGYEPTRVATGVVVALLLLGLAVGLVRRTDWSPIGEEAAPEIDQAVYADLDAIVASLPPEDDLADATSVRP